jgi:hypothetical protein
MTGRGKRVSGERFSSELVLDLYVSTQDKGMSQAYQLLNPSVPGGPDKRKVAYFYDGELFLSLSSLLSLHSGG